MKVKLWPARAAGLCVLLVVLTLPGCAPGSSDPEALPGNVDDFLAEAEGALEERVIAAERAGWVQNNFITHDTELLSAEAYKQYIATAMDYAKKSTHYDGSDLSYDQARKLKLLKSAITLPAPSDPAMQARLTELTTAMQSRYGKGEYCRQAGGGEECLALGELSRVLASSRDDDELLDIWRGWRTVSPPMRDQYREFVEIANEGARELGFADTGALWRSGYDMEPDAFAAEVDRLWEQVKPLYDALHTHVRRELADHYGADVVPLDGPIPAHLLGNMWSQSWVNVYDLVGPPSRGPGYDVSRLLAAKNVDAVEMVRYGERFFSSLGFEPLPDTFWERSLFTKPQDREVVCHASAWNIDMVDDLRIKMCIEINGEDFVTVHHELGHNYYQRAYNQQPFLYRDSANDGFHEGIGDTLALSITPDYLVRVGLMDRAPGPEGDLEFLMRMALEKVAFLPFAMVVDQWRWKVFSGEITPEDYNAGWWELRTRYQGITPPAERSESDFDPGAKYHVPFNTPYTRYFLAHILQFQFHRALCREAGYDGPLHGCSIYDNKDAGAKLAALLEMGKSRPWPEALEALTGETEMDATAILDYFAPLKEWLDDQNAN